MSSFASARILRSFASCSTHNCSCFPAIYNYNIPPNTDQNAPPLLPAALAAHLVAAADPCSRSMSTSTHAGRGQDQSSCKPWRPSSSGHNSIIQEDRSLYQVLHLPPCANGDQIRAAYRRLAKQFHPDRATPQQKEASEKQFCEVQAAYAILSDPRSRAAYDAKHSLQMAANIKPGALHHVLQTRNIRPGMSSSTPAYHSAPSGFSSHNVNAYPSLTKLGRNWETDQCW